MIKNLFFIPLLIASALGQSALVNGSGGGITDAAAFRGAIGGLAVVNAVTDHEATGDGTTDDSDAINAALAAGGTVYLPAGTYLVSEPLVIPSNTTLVGDGIGRTTITLDDGSNCNVVQLASHPDQGDGILTNATTNIGIRDLSVDANRAGQSPLQTNQTSGISLRNTSRVLIERVEIYDAHSYCLSIGGTFSTSVDAYNVNSWWKGYVTDVTVRDSSFRNAWDDCLEVSGNPSIKRILVEGCTASGARGFGPGFNSGFEVDDGPSAVSFVDCVAFDCARSGFNLGHSHTGEAAPFDIQAINCFAYDIGLDASDGTLSAGFSIGGNDEETQSRGKLINCRATNCDYGIVTHQGAMEVLGGHVWDCTQGVYIYGGQKAEFIAQGMTIQGPPAASDRYSAAGAGVVMAAGADAKLVQLKDCRIFAWGYPGGRFENLSTTTIRFIECDIFNNGVGQTPGTNDCGLVFKRGNVLVERCRIYDDQGTETQSYGVGTFSSVESLEMIVRYNDLRGNGTAATLNVGNMTTVSSNDGYP